MIPVKSRNCDSRNISRSVCNYFCSPSDGLQMAANAYNFGLTVSAIIRVSRRITCMYMKSFCSRYERKMLPFLPLKCSIRMKKLFLVTWFSFFNSNRIKKYSVCVQIHNGVIIKGPYVFCFIFLIFYAFTIIILRLLN